ncbi:hypothetical protein FS837_008752, partial [Tulasnella sp. UAMH 9824]
MPALGKIFSPVSHDSEDSWIDETQLLPSVFGVSPDLSVNSLFSVAGKIALVTGGGSGIGTMIAAALVRNGAKVYIASRKEKQLKEVSDKLNAMGPGSCHYIIADLGSKAGCDALAEEVKKRESKIHILVNNSGATWGANWEDVPEKE